MFSSKSRSSYDTPVGSTTIIGAGSVIHGNIDSVGDIRIDGILKGNLTCRSKILLGPEAVVEGDIIANQADILGKVLGKVKVNDLLHLHGKAVVEGDIQANKLQIEATASFNGECQMGANIVELSADLGKASNG
ncbi:MAG: polymer-forming cytoskeletal protein [Bacteroidetes bacterium]|nr:polymer-forming cytoskeletal protein [Bacteroidota bacterium]